MTNRTAQKRKQTASQARRAKPRKGRGRRSPGLYAIGAVALVIAVMVGFGIFNRAKTPEAPGGSGSRRVIADVTSVPATALDTVGADAAQSVPTALPASTPPYQVDGKPAVLYVGAEYCPYCAAERWAMVIALSRFGTFSDLGLTTSSATDVYPSTRTLSFHGSSYQSDLIAFTGVETASNELNTAGTGYGSLDALTPEQQQLFQTFDAPPYTTSAGSIPFVLIGNRYVQSGASFMPDVLQGRSWAEIARALHDPQDPIARQVLASANVLTAAICDLTGGEPASVCTSSGVQQGAARLQAG
jgi:Domain of unknown function (DUF929)